MNWEVWPEFEFGPCKRIRIPGVREICAREIWNPELWNPEYSSRNPESHKRLTDKKSRIQFLNPETTAWNPESKSVLDSVTWGDLVQIQFKDTSTWGCFTFLFFLFSFTIHSSRTAFSAARRGIVKLCTTFVFYLKTVSKPIPARKEIFYMISVIYFLAFLSESRMS